jgi:hypothetical protein
VSGFDNTPPIGAGIADNVASNISGIISTKPNAKYASGARCTLKVNSQLVGFAFSISWRMNTTAVEVNTIDDYLPYELAPQRITCEGTISALHIPGQGIGVLLWQPDILNFLTQQYITIEARDSATDQLLFFTDKAMITSRAEEIRVDSLASVQLSFRAIGYRDERAPALPTPPPNTNASTPLASVKLPGNLAGGAADSVANQQGIANIVPGGTTVNPSGPQISSGTQIS